LEIPITYYLYLSITIFTIGLVGIFLNRKNLIILLMSIELIFLSSNINFVAFSDLYQNLVGQVFVFFVLTITAAEAAVGLAIILIFFRIKDSIHIDDINYLKE
tara:strand:- start:95 stop:403 length:309 start_codon:yes stop_codon:yes gene_type:complete